MKLFLTAAQHLDLDLGASEKATCMRKAAIVHSQFLLSSALKESERACEMSPSQAQRFCSAFSFANIFVLTFSWVRFAASFLSLPLCFLSIHTHTRTHTHTKIYMCQTFSKGKTKALS